MTGRVSGASAALISNMLHLPERPAALEDVVKDLARDRYTAERATVVAIYAMDDAVDLGQLVEAMLDRRRAQQDHHRELRAIMTAAQVLGIGFRDLDQLVGARVDEMKRADRKRVA